ncbi:unnamed protein product [Closterium sp. NIES-54]
MVTTTTPGGQRVSICTCTQTGRHLATFNRRRGSSLYTLATEPSQVAASAQVSASSQVAPPCSCRLLSHQTLLWHHRLGHPSLPRLRGMHSRLLVSGLPRSLPPLPPSPALPCLPCVKGRQRAAPHSSFPPTTAPLQTLHMDVRGPACVSGQSRERYFLLVIGDYMRYTTVFPLCSKGQVVDVLIPGIRAVRLQLRERFRKDLLFLRLHFDRVAHPAVLRLHSAFCVSIRLLPIFCGHLRSVFRVWGSHAFVRDTSMDKLSARAIPCDVTFDKSVPFYRLFPYRSAPPPPPPLFLALGPPTVDLLPPQSPSPSSVSQVDPLPGTTLVEVAVGSGAVSWGAVSRGAEPGGEESGGAEPAGVEPGGAKPKGVEIGGAVSEGAESGGAEPQGAALSGGPAGASPRLSPEQLREWLVRRARLWIGATGAGGAGAAGAGGTGVTTRAGGIGVTAATGLGGARTRAGDPTEPGAAGAGGSGAGGAGAGGAGVGDTCAGGAGAGGTAPGDAGVLGVPSSSSLTPPLLCPSHDQTQPLQPAFPLPTPSPYTEQSGGLTEHCEPPSHPFLPVRTARCVPRSRPPPVPGTHAMALRPSSVPLRVPLSAPP